MFEPRHLRKLARHAARGKRSASDVAAFLLDIDAHAASLAADLTSERYQPGLGRSFLVRDPKERLIFALPFRDRVAQHVLIDATLPAIERSMAPQSFACRTGMGTHRCLERAANLTRHHRFVLRIDIRKFFPTIDYAILRRLLDRTTPPALRWLRDRFIDSHVETERVTFHFPGDDLFSPLARPHGLPIGSLTSQIWANVYLSPIDQLIASHIGIGTFVRYCDDILVFHDDPDTLRDALAQVEARATALRLRLHPRKTRLHRTTDPVPFLGFVLQRTSTGVRIRLRNDNMTRMRRRVATLRTMFRAGAVGVDEVRMRLMAWMAHAKHGHTRTLVTRELERWTFP